MAKMTKRLNTLKKDKPAKVSDASNAKEIEHIVPQLRKAITVGKDSSSFKMGRHIRLQTSCC